MVAVAAITFLWNAHNKRHKYYIVWQHCVTEAGHHRIQYTLFTELKIKLFTKKYSVETIEYKIKYFEQTIKITNIYCYLSNFKHCRASYLIYNIKQTFY